MSATRFLGRAYVVLLASLAALSFDASARADDADAITDAADEAVDAPTDVASSESGDVGADAPDADASSDAIADVVPDAPLTDATIPDRPVGVGSSCSFVSARARSPLAASSVFPLALSLAAVFFARRRRPRISSREIRSTAVVQTWTPWAPLGPDADALGAAGIERE